MFISSGQKQSWYVSCYLKKKKKKKAKHKIEEKKITPADFKNPLFRYRMSIPGDCGNVGPSAS